MWISRADRFFRGWSVKKMTMFLAITLAGVLSVYTPQAGWSAEGLSPLHLVGSKSPTKQRNALVQKRKKTAGGGLSGDVGDVRYGVAFLEGMVGGCKKAYDRYVRASGHSAYASTPMYASEAFHCGTAMNAGSQKAAEKAALGLCESAKKRYKVVSGPCLVYASK